MLPGVAEMLPLVGAPRNGYNPGVAKVLPLVGAPRNGYNPGVAKVLPRCCQGVASFRGASFGV